MWLIAAFPRPGRDPVRKWKTTLRKVALAVFLAWLDTGRTAILGKNMFTSFSAYVSVSVLELGCWCLPKGLELVPND